jgi:hypothetical protein
MAARPLIRHDLDDEETCMLHRRCLAILILHVTVAFATLTDGMQLDRHPELCVEDVCRFLARSDCDDPAELNRLLQACTGNYNGECVRVSCGFLRTSECNDASEVTEIALACSNNVDGNCVSVICQKLGSTGCNSLPKVAQVARQCGRANPYVIPYR